jgi:hypothetical protein
MMIKNRNMKDGAGRMMIKNRKMKDGAGSTV